MVHEPGLDFQPDDVLGAGRIGGGGHTAEEAKKAEAPAEDRPTASVGVDILSQYIWRGFALSRNSAVLQPSLTAAYKGFSVNVWGNFDTGESNPFLTRDRGAKWNETDFTFGYSRELYAGTAIKSVSANIGVIYYALDSAFNPQGDSFEIYYGLGVDVNWFKLAATANQEVFHYPGWWLTLGISRVFELPLKIQDNSNVTLELGHNFIFLFSRDQVAYPNLRTSDPGGSFFRSPDRAALRHVKCSGAQVRDYRAQDRVLVRRRRQRNPPVARGILGSTAEPRLWWSERHLCLLGTAIEPHEDTCSCPLRGGDA